jgi:2-aminoadipate transaminase
MAKQGADLHTNTLSQTIAYEFLRRGWLPEQIQRIRETYRIRCQAMIEAIEQYFPKGIYYSRPQGGLFLWVALLPEIDTLALLPEAIEQKVAYVPGYPFHVTETGRNTMRLSFASVRPELIHEGIRRLGAIIQRHLR